MDKTNYRLLNKIGGSILAQFPPDSLVQANNACVNEFNNFLKNRKKQGYECLLNNNKCRGRFRLPINVKMVFLLEENRPDKALLRLD